MQLGKIILSNKMTIAIITAAALFFAIFVGGVTTFRYLNYSTSTYDFGIFTQMFYYMKETFRPDTTCERTALLSHFAIHISPIYYLLLPGYYLFSSPVYLQIMQAVVLASAVIPLYLIAKHFSLSNKVTVCICVAFCFYPALAGGCFYDLHENMFLTPLILWVLYFMEKRKWMLMYIFSFLVLMVKEDAFIYVLSIGLFLFFIRKERKDGALLSFVSTAYFLIAMIIHQTMGSGTMDVHFDNFISDKSLGIFSIVKTVVLNPAYVFTQMFTEDKVTYLILMLLPLLFLPLMNKKLSQLLLVIPFVLINLMPNYAYQHSLTFHYNFGSLALLFYLAVINIKDINGHIKKYAVPFMAVASIILFITNIGPYSDSISRYFKNKTQIEQLNTYLETIPENASVQASGYFVPKLSNHKILYDVRYNNSLQKPNDTEYIVLDLRPGNEKDAATYMTNYQNQGYQTIVDNPDLIAILKK